MNGTALPGQDALLRFLDDVLIAGGSGERVGLIIMEVDGSADTGLERTELLEHVAARGRRIVRAGDLFCALDHDVFALAWRHADEVAQAGLVARVVSAMRAPVVPSTCELELDVVIGASLSDPASTAETVLAKAERALTVMKTARRYGVGSEHHLAGLRHPPGPRPPDLDAASDSPPTERPTGPRRVATLVVDLADGLVSHIDDPAQRVLAETRGRLIGRPVAELLDPSSSVGMDLAVAALASGAIESFRGRCSLTRRGEPLDVCVSIRTISVRDARLAVWTILADAEELCTADIDAPFWHRQVELAVGLAGTDLVVSGATASAHRIEASDPRLRDAAVTSALQTGGASLLSFVHGDDAEPVRAAHAVAVSGRRTTSTDLRWFHPGGGWFDAALIMFATGSQRAEESVGFVLAERRASVVADDVDRRFERLERLVAQIAAEVRAGAKLGDGQDARSQIDWTWLNGMSNRQRDVVKRLVMGERVPTIAKAMFISTSTVRNHLSRAFDICGVSTQSDLIELFLSSATDQSAA